VIYCWFTQREVGVYLPCPRLDVNATVTLTRDDLHQIFVFLRRNKVIMRTLNYCLSRRRIRPEKVRFIEDIVARNNGFAATYDFVRRLRQKILDVSTEFTRNNIDLIFIKAFNDFPLDSDNFDILVKKQQRESAISVLASQGFRELTSLREITRYGEPFKWLFRRVDSDFPISVHIHTVIG